MEIDRCGIEEIGVVAGVGPFDFASGGLHVLERAAEILGWAGAGAGDDLGWAITGGKFLKDELVDPFVCEVVAVEDAEGEALAADVFCDGEVELVLELADGLVCEADGADDIDEALAFAVAELVRVFIFPAHGALDGVAELEEAG